MSGRSGSDGGGAGSSIGSSTSAAVGQDPALDQFMEAYCEMLIKYEQELSKPFKEAMVFLSRIETQFKAISFSNSDSGTPLQIFLQMFVLSNLYILYYVLLYDQCSYLLKT